MGIPVVSTQISGVPELVEHGVNGFLVAPRDPEALADVLRASHGYETTDKLDELSRPLTGRY